MSFNKSKLGKNPFRVRCNYHSELKNKICTKILFFEIEEHNSPFSVSNQ